MVVSRRLRDLAILLDKLNLTTECILVGNCALSLVRAIGPWSPELQLEQAETLACIASLSPYRPHARALFLQAVTLCEGAVAQNCSRLHKKSYLGILDRAGYWSEEHPDLGIQWLGQAIRIMTTEVPPTMVNDITRSRVYLNYSLRLLRLGQFSEAMEAGQKAVSLRRALSGTNPMMGKKGLTRALISLGISLGELRKYEDSVAAFEEALELDHDFMSQDPRSVFDHTLILINYGSTLIYMKQVSKAAELHQKAVTYCRVLVRMDAKYTLDLCRALRHYGMDCYLLDWHSKAIPVFEESISLARSLAKAGSTRAQADLRFSLHYMANSLHILERKYEAGAAAREFLQQNDAAPLNTCGITIEGRICFICGRRPIWNDAMCLSEPDQCDSSVVFTTGEHLSLPNITFSLTITIGMHKPEDRSESGEMARRDPSQETASPVPQHESVLFSSPSQLARSRALRAASSSGAAQSDWESEHSNTPKQPRKREKASKWFEKMFS
jgi:tetratricopeptide (TPR) repeat protein